MPGAPLTQWNCDDLAVSVESKEHNPPVPDTFSSPKWRRSAKASGSWASGTCSFSINVVPNSAFFLTVGPTGKDYPCDTISGISITPYSSPAMTVPKGMTKTLPDYTAVGQPTCHIVP